MVAFWRRPKMLRACTTSAVPKASAIQSAIAYNGRMNAKEPRALRLIGVGSFRFPMHAYVGEDHYNAIHSNQRT
jgi:hypothetical protein